MASGRAAPELAEHLDVAYASTERPLLTLLMDVFAPAHGAPKPPLLLFHGWHQSGHAQRDRARTLAARGFCVLNLNLRGRGGTVGEPDANGWEVRDACDALTAARRRFPEICSDAVPARAFGASGGGGNVLALVGKCPDLVSSAVAWCAISDYRLWFEWDKDGRYRDEMVHWIGPDPESHAEAFLSRSGLTVAGNRCCPLLLVHGQDDSSVPVEQARAYAAAQRPPDDRPCFEYRELAGVGHVIPEDPHLTEAVEFLRENGKPCTLPHRERYVVAGLLRTQHFEVFWDRPGRVGALEMDLRRRRLYLDGPTASAAQVRLAGRVRAPELIAPVPPDARLVSQREEAGWSVLDVALHGQRCGVQWSL